MRYWKPVLGAFVACGLIGAAAFAGYVRDQLRPRDPQGAEQTFTIKPGAALSQIAHRLEDEHLIRNAQAFVSLARYHDLAASLHAGEYRVSPSWSAGAISPVGDFWILAEFSAGMHEGHALKGHAMRGHALRAMQ